MSTTNIFIHPEYLKRLSVDRQDYWLNILYKMDENDNGCLFPIYERDKMYENACCYYVNVDNSSKNFNKLYSLCNKSNNVKYLNYPKKKYTYSEMINIEIKKMHLVDIGG
jgi:hypothetical protein